jgi:hypothetical protein
LKRAKKLLPYIDIGEANKVMARAMENIKKGNKHGGKQPPPPGPKEKISLKDPPSGKLRRGSNLSPLL